MHVQIGEPGKHHKPSGFHYIHILTGFNAVGYTRHFSTLGKEICLAKSCSGENFRSLYECFLSHQQFYTLLQAIPAMPLRNGTESLIRLF